MWIRRVWSLSHPLRCGRVRQKKKTPLTLRKWACGNRTQAEVHNKKCRKTCSLLPLSENNNTDVDVRSRSPNIHNVPPRVDVESVKSSAKSAKNLAHTVHLRLLVSLANLLSDALFHFVTYNFEVIFRKLMTIHTGCRNLWQQFHGFVRQFTLTFHEPFIS